ncbi:MAG: hypothetical protein IPO36_18770 [Anaerolineales bacterium]|nr:hypothetical protein [Anaerolineales bacterium]
MKRLASFGAPAQVVTISRGPSITQFGVEPLFLESRGGVRTKVRVSKIASLPMIWRSPWLLPASVFKRRAGVTAMWVLKCLTKKWRWWFARYFGK